jgi:hypothetical protein
VRERDIYFLGERDVWFITYFELGEERDVEGERERRLLLRERETFITELGEGRKRHWGGETFITYERERERAYWEWGE